MNKKFLFRVFAVVLILAGIGIAGYTALYRDQRVDESLVFSHNRMLGGLWNDYKSTYWESSTGRTLDRQQDDITTSEGQSYTMMRAVWQGDKQTFDSTWQWTKNNIQRDDKLFSWLWGERADGSYGVLSDRGGENTASDADIDIAMALLMAAGRWQEQGYLNEAEAIIPQIWEEEVLTVNDTPYLASNNLEKASDLPIVMNVSYFAPYAFREFAKVDKTNDWNALIDSSYELTNRAMSENLDKSESAQLPPDWVLMNRETGDLYFEGPQAAGKTTNYSYDAIRTPWRLALDYQWNDEPRARETLERMSFLSEQWDAERTLYSTYGHDGEILVRDEPLEMYGTALGYFMTSDPDAAQEIYDSKIVTLYDQNQNAWSQDMTYYGDNWTWFGMALYLDALDNYAETIE